MLSKVMARGSGKCSKIQKAAYAKKVPPTNAPPSPPPRGDTKQSGSKIIPAPAPMQDRLFDINRRDFWKKREYDFTPANVEAMNYYLSQTAAVREKLIKDHPALKDVVLQNHAVNAMATEDIAQPIRVAVTGAAGAIGYALIARLASGDCFGPKRRIILHLLELPGAMNALKGVEMELRDSAFPLVEDIVCTDSVEKAFEGVDYALLVGAQPRKEGMERGDLLMKNAEIFSIQGKALNKVAKGKNTRVAVVGNPANTNAMIAQRNAPNIPPENFMAMTRLDHNRALAQIVLKTGCDRLDIQGVTIWGNHSATQVPDLSNATIRGVPAIEVINDNNWIENNFIPTVQKRGAAIIAARKASSAASAASALDDMVRNWNRGTAITWTSGAVYSNGEYGVDKGLFFSYPITHDPFQGGKWKIVEGLKFNDATAKRIEVTLKELRQERDGVAKYL